MEIAKQILSKDMKVRYAAIGLTNSRFKEPTFKITQESTAGIAPKSPEFTTIPLKGYACCTPRSIHLARLDGHAQTYMESKL